MFYTRAWCVIFEDRKMEGTIKVPLAISTPKQTVMKGLDEPTLEAAIRAKHNTRPSVTGSILKTE